MRNIKLTVEYEGTDYCGWQIQRSTPAHQYTSYQSTSHQSTSRQSKKKSIQEIIEKALQKILQEKAKLTASGRTDSGVHAEAQTANFKTKSKIPLRNIQRALNTYLPDDIKIIKIEEAPIGFHSRFDAKSKTYRYIILNRESPSAVYRNFVYHIPQKLNFNLIKREARALIGRHDFKSFQAADNELRESTRTIKRLDIKRSGDFINIEIEADGFLYNMVRNIVGTLMEIGRGRIEKGGLSKILQAKDRKTAGPTAPAKGLRLVEVKY